MCAIAYYLEDEGIMTTGIALVRENAEVFLPPRLLWVSFPLGRPMGNPNDPEFQTRVLKAGLELLSAEAGPVLEDFPEDAEVADTTPPVCPVSFSRSTDTESWVGQLHRELELLKPWYELSLSRRARTTVGLLNESIEALIETIGNAADDPDQPTDLMYLKSAIEDTKAYYLEAMTAQPGEYNFVHLQQQLWDDTVLGSAMRHLAAHFQRIEKLQVFARVLEPRQALVTGTRHD